MFVSKAAAEDCGGFIWPIRLTLKNEEFYERDLHAIPGRFKLPPFFNWKTTKYAAALNRCDIE
jgi:hypothetical protein